MLFNLLLKQYGPSLEGIKAHEENKTLVSPLTGASVLTSYEAFQECKRKSEREAENVTLTWLQGGQERPGCPAVARLRHRDGAGKEQTQT